MKVLDLSNNLYIKYESLETISHYYGILAIFALVQTAEEQKSDFALSRVKKILERFPDEIAHSFYNFPSYLIGGNARAYALFKGIMNDDVTIELVKKYADEILYNAPKTADGIIKMPGSDADLIWIDVVTAITPFLLYAGLYFDRKEYVDFAVYQCLAMYRDLVDETGLVNQCRGFVASGKKSSDHWSRGNGWGYLGFTELIKYLPKTYAYYQEIMETYVKFSTALLAYQSPDGVWHQEITEPRSYKESSGTALILYGFGTGLRLGLLPKEKFDGAFKKGIASFPKLFIDRDFSTELCCPGCLCPGQGAEKGSIEAYCAKAPVRNEHHSFGALMLALTEAHRNGITELNITGLS